MIRLLWASLLDRVEWLWSRAKCGILGHQWGSGGPGVEVCSRIACRGAARGCRVRCICDQPATTEIYDANGWRRWCGQCGRELTTK